jgi:hypothetical protein
VERNVPSRLEAVIPPDVMPEGSHKIRFYHWSLPVNLARNQAQLAWFSYTNPPKDKRMIWADADMPVYGGFIHHETVFVCSPISAEASTPVLNAFLHSMAVKTLNGSEAREFALLSAKCIGATQIYGDSKRISDDVGRELLAKVAAFPTVETAENQTKVVFYSWEALRGSVVKWSFVFGPQQVVSIHEEEVEGGQLILKSTP